MSKPVDELKRILVQIIAEVREKHIDAYLTLRSVDVINMTVAEPIATELVVTA